MATAGRGAPTGSGSSWTTPKSAPPPIGPVIWETANVLPVGSTSAIDVRNTAEESGTDDGMIGVDQERAPFCGRLLPPRGRCGADRRMKAAIVFMQHTTSCIQKRSLQWT